MDTKTIITLVVIGAITALEAWALYLGYDGALLSTVIAALAALGGFEVKALLQSRQK